MVFSVLSFPTRACVWINGWTFHYWNHGRGWFLDATMTPASVEFA